MKIFIRLACILMLAARITSGQDYTNLTFSYAGGLDGWATAEHDAREYLEAHGITFPEGAGIKRSEGERGTLVLRNTPDNIKRAAQVMSDLSVLPLTVRLKVAVAEDGIDSPTATTFLLENWSPYYGDVHHTTTNGPKDYCVTALGRPAEEPRTIQVSLLIGPRRGIAPYTPQEANYPTNDLRMISLIVTNGVPAVIPVDFGQNLEHIIRFEVMAEVLLESGQPLW